MTPRPSPTIYKLYPNVIILLHGFNSAPGKKEEEIKLFLENENLSDKYKLIAPKLDFEPIKARREINKIIRKNKGSKVYLIGTSLGGFYANYFRAKFQEENFLSVHAINPSWTPSQSLRQYKNQTLENFKTKEKWTFEDSYVRELEEFERFIQTNLKNKDKHKYYVHLSKADELLKFDGFLEFLDVHQIAHFKLEYESDHRFDKIKDVMRIIVDG